MLPRGAALLGLSVVAQASAVRAQEAPMRVAFAWVRAEGAERCASAAVLREAVRARLGRDPFDVGAPVSAEGWVGREEGQWRAWLVFRDASGAVLLRRELRDARDDCDTLSAAAALSLSLALAPAPPSVPPADDPERPTPPATNDPRPLMTPPRSRVDAGLSAGFELLSGALPGLSPGVAARTDLAWSPRWLASLRVSLQPERRTEAPDDRWAFGMTRASLGLCARATPHDRVTVLGCAQLSAGLVHGVSFGPRPVAPGNYGWASAGVEGRVVLRLVGPVVAAVAAAPQWAFARNRFVAEGREAPVYAQRADVWALEVSLGVAR